MSNVSSVIGSLLLLFSVYSLIDLSKHFLKMRIPAISLALLSATSMLLNMNGAHINTFSTVILQEKIIGLTLMGLALVEFALTIYIAYRFVCAMKDLHGDNKSAIKVLDRTWEIIIYTFVIMMILPFKFLMLIHLLSITVFIMMMYVIINEYKAAI